MVENTMDNGDKLKVGGNESHRSDVSPRSARPAHTINDARARRLAGAKRGGSASAAARRSQVERLDTFRATLIERLGTPDAVQMALIDSACALYAPVLRRSRLSLGVNPRVNVLAISAAVTGLRSVLRDLAVLTPGDMDSPPGPDATIEDRQTWSRKYVERRLAEGKEEKPQ